MPSSRDLPNPGIEPWSPTLQAEALTSEPPGKPYYAKLFCFIYRLSILQILNHSLLHPWDKSYLIMMYGSFFFQRGILLFGFMTYTTRLFEILLF